MSSLNIIVALLCSIVSGTGADLPYPPAPPLGNSTPPVLGHVPYFGPKPFETFMKWKEAYGPVVGMKFGKIPAVILGEPTVIRKVLEEPALGGRPTLPLNLDRSEGQVEGVLFTEGDTWVEQREFAQHHLNTYSDYGAESLEHIVQKVAADLVGELAREGVKPNRFSTPVFKILWSVFTGRNASYNDPGIQIVSGGINAFVRGGPPEAELLQIVPELAPFLPPEVQAKLPKYEDVLGLVKSISEFVKKQIAENQEQLDRGDKNSRKNYIGKYLEKMGNTKDPGSSFHGEKGLKSLTFSLVDMIIAGTETISTTLEWAMLYLAKHPQTQAKLHAELDSVLGSRAASLSDRSRLPYTDAVLKEVLRLSSIVPLSVFHKALEDTKIEGYKVDKDSIIIANTYGVHHDPKNWGDDVQEFRPERFLESGQKEPDGFMPFGAGYRVCLGKKVAKEVLFLMLGNLLSKLEVVPVKGEQLSMEPKVTQVLTPKDHFINANLRK